MRDLALLAVAVAGIAAALVVFAKPRRLPKHATRAAGSIASTSVSVIIPARNEAGSLPNLLHSLVGAPAAEIIVVDDHSSDGTAATAASFGARVVSAPDLPDGWAGKNWACAVGADAAVGADLLFLDADVSMSAGAVADLIAVHQHHGGLVSVQPFHRTERPYEELSALFNAVAVMGSGCFSAGRPDLESAQLATAAFGPVLLLSRLDYERIGGHTAVRGEVVEDIALARRCHEAGLPVSAWLGGTSVSFRMYPDGLGALVQGWTKNIAMGARLAAPAPVAATVVWIVALAAVAGGLTSGVVDWLGGGGPPIAAAIAWLAMVVHLHLVLRRLGTFRLLTSVLYVVPLAMFLAVFVRSGWYAVRGADVTWRGRTVASRTTGS